MLIFLQGCRQISDKPGLTITKAGEIIDFLMVPGYLSQSSFWKTMCSTCANGDDDDDGWISMAVKLNNNHIWDYLENQFGLG